MSFTVDPLRVIVDEIDRYRFRFGDAAGLSMRVNSEVARRIPLAGVSPEDIKNGFTFAFGGADMRVDDAVPHIEVSVRYRLNSVVADGAYVA